MHLHETLHYISSAIDAPDEEQLKQKMQIVARSIGFEHVVFGIEMRQPLMEPIRHITSGYPLEYQKIYADRGFLRKDPTVVHCLASSEPLIWHENFYTEKSHEILEESRRFGLGYGISIPVRESSRITSMLSLARDRPIESKHEQDLVLSTANVLAHCVHVASAKIIIPSMIQDRRRIFTPRELECLKWAAHGKSNSVIAEILNVAEPTVAFHIKNILKKLEVATRLQAVTMALSLGLI
jgi:DNA-binding CsgD family transcriptional regulator